MTVLGLLKLWPYLAGLVVLLAAWVSGHRAGKTSVDKAILKEYKSTRERMDGVKIGNDPAVLREWLRERGKQ